MRGPRSGSRVAVLMSAWLALAAPDAAKAQEPTPQEHAEETADSLAVLTLDDAVAIARSANPAFRRAVGALDLNGVERRSTLASQVLPNLDISLLNTSYTGFLTRRAVDDFGRPVENPEASWLYNSSTDQGISLRWDIQGLSFLNDLKQQDRTNNDRVLALANEGWVLEAEVRRLYFDALEQQELLDVETQIRAAREVDLETAQRLFEIAQRSRVDVLNAELQVAQQDQNIQEQIRSYEQALLELRAEMGDDNIGEFRPAPVDFTVFDPSGISPDTLVQLALEANPRLRQARGAVSGAELGVTQANESWFPSLSFQFNYGRLAQTVRSDAFLDFTPEPNDWRGSFLINLSVPVLNDFFQDRAELAQAQVELDNREEDLREERLEVDRQVRTQWINLNNQHQSLQLAQRSFSIAQEAVRLAREEYRLGIRTLEQVQESVDQGAEAARQVIQARYGFVDAYLALEEAMGRRFPPELVGND